jgi:hypothetical protein
VFLDRQTAHYKINVIYPLIVLTSMTVLVWLIPVDEFAARLTLDFTLVLVGQALKLVVNEKLPPVTYLTLIDAFINGSLLFTILAVVFHSVPSNFISLLKDSNEDAATDATSGKVTLERQVDLVLAVCWFLMYIIFNLIFIRIARKEKAERHHEMICDAREAGFELRSLDPNDDKDRLAMRSAREVRLNSGRERMKLKTTGPRQASARSMVDDNGEPESPVTPGTDFANPLAKARDQMPVDT